MKKITLLTTIILLCLGVLALVGCSDEPEVVERSPIVQECLVVEEPAIEEPIPEPKSDVVESETVEQKISDAELEAAIRQLASNDPYNNVTLQRGLDLIVDFVVYNNINSNRIDDTFMIKELLIQLDRNHNNYGLLKKIRDNQTNATLIELYDNLIDLATKESNGEISLGEYIIQSRPVAEALRSSDIMADDAFVLASAHTGTFGHVPGDVPIILDGNPYSIMQLAMGSTEDKKKAPLIHIWAQLMGRARTGQDLNVPIFEIDLVSSSGIIKWKG